MACLNHKAIIKDTINTTFMSFDIEFIRHNQKMQRNGEDCQGHSIFSGQAKVNLVSNYITMVFYLSCNTFLLQNCLNSSLT